MRRRFQACQTSLSEKNCCHPYYARHTQRRMTMIITTINMIPATMRIQLSREIGLGFATAPPFVIAPCPWPDPDEGSSELVPTRSPGPLVGVGRVMKGLAGGLPFEV